MDSINNTMGYNYYTVIRDPRSTYDNGGGEGGSFFTSSYSYSSSLILLI